MTQPKRKKKYTKRIAAAAGSLAGLALAPVAADAGVVVVTGSPVSMSLSDPVGSSATWDIDGDGNSDFRLWMAGGTAAGTYAGAGGGTFYTYYGGTFQYYFSYSFRRNNKFRTIFLASSTASGGQGNGRGMAAPTATFTTYYGGTVQFGTDNVKALRSSTNVGPSHYFGRGPKGGTGGSASNGTYPFRNAMFFRDISSSGFSTFNGFGGSFSLNYSASGIGYDFAYYDGFGPGENFVGFQFLDANGDLHYGFAVFDFDVVNGVLTIDRWAYESTPNTPIHVERIGNVVPEPSSLALLASGAAGVLAYRARRKRAPKKTETTEAVA